MNVNGKNIVVTGAGSGIGRALVEKFVAEDARQVVAVDINSGNAQQTANDYGCVAMTADVSRDEDIKRVVEETESSIGPIDLFCSNAGVGMMEPEQLADIVIEGLEKESFLILPHPEVETYMQRKTGDYDRWIKGMNRLHLAMSGEQDGGAES